MNNRQWIQQMKETELAAFLRQIEQTLDARGNRPLPIISVRPAVSGIWRYAITARTEMPPCGG